MAIMTAFGEQMRRLMTERDTSLHQLAKIVNYDVGYLSKVRNGRKPASRELAAVVDRALGADGALVALGPGPEAKPGYSERTRVGGHRPVAGLAIPGGKPDNGDADPCSDADEEADPTRRRDALKLGLAASLAPQALERVLREAAADAMEFTRLTGSPGVGGGTFDHLEAATTELNRAYTTRPPAELVVIARAYRTRVHELLQGRHNLAEGRQLYVYAAWLDELLAWLAHDLGDLLTARAYAIDCFEHAAQAGHNELCAWAAASMSEIALDQNRLDQAVSAAAKGIGQASASHPLAVRLRAHAACAYARLGKRGECEDLLTEARKLWDRLPATAPAFLDPGTMGDYSLCAYPVWAYLYLGDFAAAKRHAEEAVAAAEARSHQVPAIPTTGAASRLYLAIALAELGQPDEAIAHGRRALDSPRMVHWVTAPAKEFDVVLMRRYPKLPAARQFHEQWGELAHAGRAELD
jgi:tetratricopeptide (TPR) repeat protein